MRGCGYSYSDNELEQFFVCGVYSEVTQTIMLCPKCSQTNDYTNKEVKNGKKIN